MLTKDEFIDFILKGPQTIAALTVIASEQSALPEGFDGFDTAKAPTTAPGDTATFARRLLEASAFGYPELVGRDTVIRSSDAVARYLPDRVSFWPKTPSRPYQTLLFETPLTHRQLLEIPAFKARKMSHLDMVEDALARLVSEALEGFQRGGESVTADIRKGRKEETLCVISILDEREGEPVRLVCFGTQNKITQGLETFQITERTRTWDGALAREHLALVYERQFKKLASESWQEAFTTTEERKQAERLVEICTRRAPKEIDIQEGVLDLLDTIAKGFGLRRKPNTERRLLAFALPQDHDIGIDPEERASDFGGRNPFGGVTLRDDRSRLLGYIVYPLTTKDDAARLHDHLEANNRFHNVLVIYPDQDQTNLELWQGREQLTGRLRKGQGFRDAAEIVNLLSRFFVVSKAKVRNPAELAQELAYRARYLRRLAVKQLEEEQDKGPLRNLFNAFRATLIHEQDEEQFADAFAQTITYGLLTARWIGNDQLVASGQRFTRVTAFKEIPAASPFLNEFFKSVLLVKLDEQQGRFLWLVDDISDLLDRIDVSYVFGAGDESADKATDPVIHFYEPFLAAYDKDLKNKRGVFFTPRPVVSYIVRSVHELLQSEFGLEDGLAATDSWRDMVGRMPGLTVPEGIKPSDPFVCILDPATGTGTFLFECIDIIEQTVKARWCRELHKTDVNDAVIVAKWAEYVPKYLLPRLHGYEVMIASYAIAHLKLSFKLAQSNYHLAESDRLHVHLTNTLEAPSAFADAKLAGLFATLAHEAQEVDNIKRTRRFTVVIGNPPYSNYSANLSVQARAIVDKYRSFGGAAIRERNQLQFERNLQDDFVKFIAIAEGALDCSGIGVMGFITNATMLASPSLRGMREHLLRDFQALYELHLHGGVNEISEEAQGDQNVFDIAQAVAIHVYVRVSTIAKRHLNFCELWGPRSDKYAFLDAHSVTNTVWSPVSIDGENCAFVPQGEGGGQHTMRLDEVFVKFGAGIKTNRDAVAICFSKAELVEAITAYSPKLKASSTGDEYIHPLLYRPFDRRYIFYHQDVVASRSLPTMQHMLAGLNIGLIASSTWTTPDRFSVNVARVMVEMKTGTHDRGTTFFPFYRYETLLGGHPRKVHNLTPEFCAAWERTSACEIISEGSGDLVQTAGPEDVLHWIYGLCYSPTYRLRCRAMLAQGFPLVLFPKSSGVLRDISGLGKRLVAVHLLENAIEDDSSSYAGPRHPEVEKISYEKRTVWLDKAKTSGFVGVPEDVWAFHVGGYPVCEKWLKDRKDRQLSTAEIKHYQRIVIALKGTLQLMVKIDQAINKHGGWSGAFAAKVAEAHK